MEGKREKEIGISALKFILQLRELFVTSACSQFTSVNLMFQGANKQIKASKLGIMQKRSVGEYE